MACGGCIERHARPPDEEGKDNVEPTIEEANEKKENEEHVRIPVGQQQERMPKCTNR